MAASHSGFPAQEQTQQPGIESRMEPKPRAVNHQYRGSGKLMDKVALITGGDSGIGRAVAVCYAREGADVAIVYFNEHKDARETARLVENEGRRCMVISGDIGEEAFCQQAVARTVEEFGKLDILVNSAAEQHLKQSIEEISAEQLERTFRTNIFSQFFLTKAALRHLESGSAIVNTSSVTAFHGNPVPLDDSATKGAIVAFTRSLSKALEEKGIRVNAVAPGPVWTPLFPASFPAQQVESFGQNVQMGRAGRPEQIALSYVFLASDDSSYMSGEVLHPNGGEPIG